jgi:hypothetical protein
MAIFLMPSLAASFGVIGRPVLDYGGGMAENRQKTRNILGAVSSTTIARSG